MQYVIPLYTSFVLSGLISTAKGIYNKWTAKMHLTNSHSSFLSLSVDARRQSNHSNKAKFDDSVLADGAALMAALAFDTLDEAAGK